MNLVESVKQQCEYTGLQSLFEKRKLIKILLPRDRFEDGFIELVRLVLR